MPCYAGEPSPGPQMEAVDFTLCLMSDFSPSPSTQRQQQTGERGGAGRASDIETVVMPSAAPSQSQSQQGLVLVCAHHEIFNALEIFGSIEVFIQLGAIVYLYVHKCAWITCLALTSLSLSLSLSCAFTGEAQGGG